MTTKTNTFTALENATSEARVAIALADDFLAVRAERDRLLRRASRFAKRAEELAAAGRFEDAASTRAKVDAARAAAVAVVSAYNARLGI